MQSWDYKKRFRHYKNNINESTIVNENGEMGKKLSYFPNSLK